MSAFQFHAKQDLTILLGLRASTVRELREGIARVPDTSIYFHTHKFLEQHHYLTPEPSNDFAYWSLAGLNDQRMADQLASVDIVQYESIGALRNRILEVITAQEKKRPGTQRAAEGAEFHFQAVQTFVFPTAFSVETLAEFSDAAQRVSLSSIYYHMFDARLRLGKGENDFSAWFRDLGYTSLAGEVRALDPYAYTLESLRKRLLVLVRRHEHA